MLSVDDMNSRVMKINFDNEPGLKKDTTMVRKFTKIRRDATKDQILTFAKAISGLTANGADGDLTANVFDHFMLMPDPD